MPHPSYVRVLDPSTGHKSSQPVGGSLQGFEVLDGESAVDEVGRPLPPEFPKPSKPNKSGQKADPEKETN